MPSIVWLAVLFPLFGVGSSFMAERPRRAGQVCLASSVIALGISLVLLWYRVVHPTPTVVETLITFWTTRPADAVAGAAALPLDFHPQIGFRVDALSTIFLAVMSFVSVVIQWFALVTDKADAVYRRFAWVAALLTCAVLGLVASANLFTFVVMSGFATLSVYLLLGLWGWEMSAAKSAMRSWRALVAADAFLIGLLVLSFVAFGARLSTQPLASGQDVNDPFSFSLLDTQWNSVGTNSANSGGVPLALLAICVIAIVWMKSAQFPLGSWTVRVEQVPASVLALVLTLGLSGGILLFARMYGLLLVVPHVLPVLVCVGAFTAVVSAAAAFASKQLISVVVYASLSQLGLIVATLALGGYSAALFMLVGFLLVTAVGTVAAVHLARSYGTGQLDEMREGWMRMRVTTIGLWVWAVALCGVTLAPYNAFATAFRNQLPNGGHMASLIAVIAVVAAAIACALTVVAALKVTLTVSRGELQRRRGLQPERIHDAGFMGRVMLVILIGGVLFVPLLGIPGIPHWTFSHFVFFGSIRQQLPLNGPALLLSSVVLVLGIGGAWWLFGGGRHARMEKVLSHENRIVSVVARGVGSEQIAPVFARYVGTAAVMVGRLLHSVEEGVIQPACDALGTGVHDSGSLLDAMQSRYRRFEKLILVVTLSVVVVVIFVVKGR